MQTLSMIALATVALIVAAFELRELFIGWYSEVTPSLTWSNYVSEQRVLDGNLLH
jgi:hypothetical protein